MLVSIIALDLCQALSRWPEPDGWTGVGFVATVTSLVVGAVALLLTWRIYKWTEASDAERHAELKDALREMGGLLQPALARTPMPLADLTALSREEDAKLRALLNPGEQVVRLARSGSGKGNHPWQAITTAGRVVQVYTGGRHGGVHARILN